MRMATAYLTTLTMHGQADVHDTCEQSWLAYQPCLFSVVAHSIQSPEVYATLRGQGQRVCCCDTYLHILTVSRTLHLVCIIHG